MDPLQCQKDLFSLDSDAHYLNCAAYSPILNSSKIAGYRAIDIKCNPQQITPDSHFDGVKKLRESLADLLDARDPDRIAIFPSVSYGMAIVAANLHRLDNISLKKNIVVLQNEFPNDTYAFSRVAAKLKLTITSVSQPQDFDLMGELWNMQLLQSISRDTAAVVIPNVHWIYGVVFDLEDIADKCRECGALLVVDGSQSVGALPLDVGRIQPDALICAGYKWMFGPYSLSFGYFGEFFDNGVPVEESWMNRQDSHVFSSLTNLTQHYRPKAQRYNMGESSDFIHVAMMCDSLRQLLEWRVSSVRDYARELSEELVEGLAVIAGDRHGDQCCRALPASYRAPHLIAIMLPKGWEEDAGTVVGVLKSRGVFLSLRGPVLRVSVNVFNDRDDVQALLDELQRILFVCDESDV
jgi:selenocysteine lyase/cysteine desulfurase